MESDPSIELLAYCSEHVLELPDASRPIVSREHEYSYSYSCSLYAGHMSGERVLVKAWRGATQLSTNQKREVTKRISRELSTWKKLLPHPHIAPFIGLFSGYGYLPSLVLPLRSSAMEYIESNPGVNVLKLLMDVAAGLAHMHQSKPPVVHGMLKGSNILISDEGNAQITDIGISSIPFGTYHLTIGNGDINSSRWIAPELMDPDSGIAVATIQSDVYAFGMTSLELITGRLPFSHRRMIAPVIRDVVAGIRPRREHCTEVDDNVWELLEACWMHDPAKRPSMATVFSWITLCCVRKLPI